jgi:NhaP-type Na+/H+ or K+/H+ antiporter
MLTSLALIFIVGMGLAFIFEKFKLPRLIGMLLTGILLGPYVLNLLDPEILLVSGSLRELALVVILLKAGLSLNIEDLKKVGRPAIMLSFIPAILEITATIIFAPMLLGVTYIEAAIMGTVIGAVSPAVIVPKMVSLMEEGYGTNKRIPQMILAGASMDDVFVIVLFTVAMGLGAGNDISVWSFTAIPISIVLGLGLGIVTGIVLSWFFKKHHMRDSMKVVIILGISFMFLALEDMLNGLVPISGLLAVMSMGIAIQARRTIVADRLAAKFGKLWVAAEVILFVLVGAEVDIWYAKEAGIVMILLILSVLVFRSIGVLICMIKTNLNWKERVFCVLSYLPKATVQAAIGAVPLAAGYGCGQIVLTAAVVSILLAAPIGAIGMDAIYKKFLKN